MIKEKQKCILKTNTADFGLTIIKKSNFVTKKASVILESSGVQLVDKINPHFFSLIILQRDTIFSV